jgi:hypothetical protein
MTPDATGRKRIALAAAMLVLLLGGCRENRAPNQVISEAVDEMKLADRATAPGERLAHLERAVAAFERVLRDYPRSRAAQFLREGGKFNGLTLEELKARRTQAETGA